MDSGNAGPGPTITTTLDREMRAFDRLPRRIRRCLAYAPLLFFAENVLQDYRRARRHGVREAEYEYLLERSFRLELEAEKAAA